MERILVAVDGSEHSTKAVDAAASMATAVGAKLSLLAVVPSMAAVAGDLESYARSENLLNELPRLLASVQPAFLEPAAARARAKRVTEVSLETATGDPATEILATAHAKGVDLIVMGSRGRGRLSGLLLGSVSQQVSSHAPCSVLIVR
jgi:nucleotide-binding universal stress UspA family protein